MLLERKKGYKRVVDRAFDNELEITGGGRPLGFQRICPSQNHHLKKLVMDFCPGFNGEEPILRPHTSSQFHPLAHLGLVSSVPLTKGHDTSGLCAVLSPFRQSVLQAAKLDIKCPNKDPNQCATHNNTLNSNQPDKCASHTSISSKKILRVVLPHQYIQPHLCASPQLNMQPQPVQRP